MNEYLTKFDFEFGKVGVYKVEEPVIGYKKIICREKTVGKYVYYGIAVLCIPEESIIVRSFHEGIPSEQLRSDKAFVKDIKIDGTNLNINDFIFHSYHYPDFIYEKDSMVYAKPELNLDINETNEAGIHFFLDINKAINYY